MEGNVFFQNNKGFRLAAAVEGLKDGMNLPVVIFAHGLYSGKDSPRNREIAHGLNEAGLATLLIDFTGHGESEGSMDDVSVEQFVSDIDSAIAFLGSFKGVDSAQIGVCGSSLGGTAALLAATRDNRIRALVLRSAPVEGFYQYGEKVKVPTLIVQGEADPIARESMELFERLGGEKKIELISGAGHLYERPEQLGQARKVIAKWFQDKLKPKGGKHV
jgi:pimeloyl-ACP methyl ester carboxylesterase